MTKQITSAEIEAQVAEINKNYFNPRMKLEISQTDIFLDVKLVFDGLQGMPVTIAKGTAGAVRIRLNTFETGMRVGALLSQLTGDPAAVLQARKGQNIYITD